LGQGQGRKGLSKDLGNGHMGVVKVPLGAGVCILSRGQGRNGVSKDPGKGHLGVVKVPLGVGVSVWS